MTLLQINHLVRRIPGNDNPLLDDISLSIQPGERVGLAGGSGSGKTSLLRTIALLDPISSGQILFRGQPVTNPPSFRRQVIYLHQRPAMIGGSVRDNLQLPFKVASATGSYNEVQIDDWIDSLGKSADFINQAADTLSGGEQQLVALMRAIQIDPLVLLLDEPSASLDGESAQKFEQLVELFLAGADERALVWVSHDESQLARMTSRVVTMADGRIVT